MKITRTIRGLAVLALAAVSATAVAERVQIDTTDPQNGMTEIFSATFDGAMSACTGASPSYCSFFGGLPPVTPPAPPRAITFTPNPSRAVNGVPDGIGPGLPPISPPQPVPAAGSFLELTRAPGNGSVTLAGGTIMFPDLPIVIQNETVINARRAGIAINPSPQVATIDGNGVAEFLVDTAPAIAVDFSAFTVVATDCSGNLCSLIQVLTLDMVRYRLLIDYDPTFTSFTASFIGKTGNNSFVYATLNSGNVVVSDEVGLFYDLRVPFGTVSLGLAPSETVTVTNAGTTSSVQIGQIAMTNPLLAPFTLMNDNCSNQNLAPAASCTFEVQFEPTAAGAFQDTLDIPTNDAGSGNVTLSVSGTGSSNLVPDINITDSNDPANDLRIGFRTVLVATTAEETITVGNNGAGDLNIGTIGQVSPIGAPFDIVTDNCSGQVIAPAGSCTITVSFTPGAIEAYTSNFDIPSDDPDEESVLFALSGNGGGVDNPPAATGADSGFMAVDPLTLLGLLGLLGVAARRRSRARSH